MSNPQSPHVVENLTPKNSTGAPTATYELTRASVSPRMVTGRDKRGFAVEDTVPTVYWQPFMMRDGSINKVPLRTGSVFSMQAEAKAYEDEIVTELITEGCIPAWLCPHSMKYQHLTGGTAFVPGGVDCGGSTKDKFAIAVSGGCEHLQKVGEERRAHALATHNAEADKMADAEAAKYQNMTNSIVQGVGEAIARHIPQGPEGAAQRKANLRDGKHD